MINVLDHYTGWVPPTDADCLDWQTRAGLDDTVVLRELSNFWEWEQTTAGLYGVSYQALFLLDRDKRIRLRWEWDGAWSSQALAQAIDGILAEP